MGSIKVNEGRFLVFRFSLSPRLIEVPERGTRNEKRSYGRAVVRLEVLDFLCTPLRAQAVKQSHAAVPSQY